MKYLIRWNAGWGENYEVVEADSKEEADKMAYEEWREEAETNAEYYAVPFTEEVAEDYGLEDEL